MPLTSDFQPHVRRALWWLIGFRFIGNVGVRFAFSFIEAISRGSGLSVKSLGWLLAVRDLAGATAPLLGRVADRQGFGRTMTFAAVGASTGLGLASLGQIGLVIGFIIFGFGKIGYDVAMNAWIADQVAYERRGRALGLVEMSWAAAALIGLPACGLLIDHVGWWAASAVLALLGFPVVFAINATVEGGTREAVEDRAPLHFPPLTIAVLVTFCALTMCSQLLIVGHGLWLGDVYDFDATQIGFAVVSIGIVEALASSGSTFFTDRLGKRVSMILGMLVLTVATTALTLDSSPPLAMGIALLAVAFLGFEFAFVSALPLITELDPPARAQMIGLALGLSTVTRAAMSLIGTWLYVDHGFSTLMMLSSIAAVISLGLLFVVVREPDAPVREVAP